MAPLLELSLAPSSLIPAVWLLKLGSSKDLHSRPVVLQLGFPAELDPEAVGRFLAGLSGLLPPWPRRWLTRPVVIFEVVATSNGVIHHLVIPRRAAATIQSALSAHLPSVRYERIEADESKRSPESALTIGAEYRLNTSQRTLRSEPIELSTGLLSSLWPLGAREGVSVQWLLTPAAPVQPAQLQSKDETPSIFNRNPNALGESDAVAALKAKQSQPLLLALARVSVTASDKDRARALLHRVEAPWHASRAPGVHLSRRFLRIQLQLPLRSSTISTPTFIGWLASTSFAPASRACSST